MEDPSKRLEVIENIRNRLIGYKNLDFDFAGEIARRWFKA